MLGSSTRRGRAPANNSDVLAMFRLVYSGEGATQPLVDDSSYYSTEIGEAWPLRAKLSGWSISESGRSGQMSMLSLPEGYLVHPSSKVSAFLQSILEECTAGNSKDPLGAKVCKEGSASLESMPGRHTRGRDRVPEPTLHSWCHKPSKDSNC
ncbi:hypothetical protein ABBQ32_008744 [Trebouxia sp. C0010 RCD-2024]